LNLGYNFFDGDISTLNFSSLQQLTNIRRISWGVMTLVATCQQAFTHASPSKQFDYAEID
jgi:hypothetical protein